MKKLFPLLFVLTACTTQSGTGVPDPQALLENPLVQEVVADQSIEYLALMQINAEELNQPITAGHVLRTIDNSMVEMRALQKQAHKRQREGRMGRAYGVNNNFAMGEVLLEHTALHMGYEFEVSAAPGITVYLAHHVAPHTKDDLFVEDTFKIGPLRSIYSAQSYVLPYTLSREEFLKYRTVAFYSEPLRQVIALAQLSNLE